MKIAVCIKRVPDSETRVKIAADGKSLDEAGVKFVLNPYDEFAVEEALRRKEKAGAGEVAVFCLGPAAAQETIRTALAMGADRGVLLSADKIPADPLESAKILAHQARAARGRGARNHRPDATARAERGKDRRRGSRSRWRAGATAARRGQGPVTTLAVLEQRDGALRKISFEVVTGAQRLGEPVEAVVCGAGAVQGVDQVAKFGADKIVTLTNPAFARYAPEAFAQVLAERAKQAGYRAIVFAASATGKDLAPRVAAKLGVAVAGDLTDLKADGDCVVVTRPVYAGKALLKVKVVSQPAVLSLRPNVFTPVERPKAATTETVAVNVAAGRVTVREIKAAPAGTLDVAEAQVIISGGRGLKEPANFKVLEELAQAFGGRAAVGASRAVVDAGWRSHADQVGQTGKTVSPSLYIAVGISGAIQHLAGMRTSKVIVAINKDKDAPIFKVADYGVVGDLFEIVPKLTEEIRKLHG